MSVSGIVLSDVFYPFNQLSAQDFSDHRFIGVPGHSKVVSTFVSNGSYGRILDLLKIDKINLLKKLIQSKSITDKWIKFLMNCKYERFMFFNVEIRYGFKVAAGTKAIFGHNALVIIPSNNDLTNEISRYIEYHFRQDTLISKFFDCLFSPWSLLFSKSLPRLKHDTTVDFLFDYTEEFSMSMIKAIKGLKELAEKPLKIIGLDPREIRTSDLELQEEAEMVIDLILYGFKIKSLLETEFLCSNSKNDSTPDMTAVIAEISTNQLKLSNTLVSKRSHQAKNYILPVYQNITDLLQAIFSQYEAYCGENALNDYSTVFPKIPFADTLMGDLKLIYAFLSQNYTSFEGDILFKWNPSTKTKIMAAPLSDNYGIIITKENFDLIKEHYDNFEGSAFLALNSTLTFNNIEPLIFVKGVEAPFGFGELAAMLDTYNRPEVTGTKYEYWFSACDCGNSQYRYWICKGCWGLYQKEDKQYLICGCGLSEKEKSEKNASNA